MSASQTLGAAIEYLEELHAGSRPDAPCVEEVVLHRITPQLVAVLRRARTAALIQERIGEKPSGPTVELAAAILGGLA